MKHIFSGKFEEINWIRGKNILTYSMGYFKKIFGSGYALSRTVDIQWESLGFFDFYIW